MSNQAPSSWIADLLAGYRTIVDASGNVQPTRNILKLGAGLSVEDDATNGRSILTADNADTLVFDARSYGVVADGVTDNLAALNSAVTALASNGGGTLILPQGTIVLSNTWTISANNVTVQGQSFGQTILQAKTGADFSILLHINTQSFVAIRDIVLDSNKTHRTGITNVTKGIQLDSCTDCVLENVISENTRGLSSASGVGIVLQGTRIIAIGCRALNCGDTGFESDGFYSSGSYIVLSDCVADTCLDTGFVFENASYSGGVNLRSNGCSAGLALGCAGNSNVTDVFFSDVVITNAIAVPIEFGLYGPNTNTGQLLGCTFNNILIDCPSVSYPAVYFSPNPTTNPSSLTYSGRIQDVVFNNLQIRALGSNQQGFYITQADGVRITGGYMNVDGNAVQTAQGSPTKILVDGVTMNMGADAIFGVYAPGVTDLVVRDCIINGGASMSWGIYVPVTSSSIYTPRNRISGAALLDESGIGGDAAVQPRDVTDGPIYRSAAPGLAGTGIWPLGMTILYKGAQLLEDASHPLGWIVTTAGVPGSAVFTPFFREARSINNAGALSAQALFYVNNTGKGNFLGVTVKPDSASECGYGFGASGELGGIDGSTSGLTRVAGTTATDLGISSGNYPWTYTLIARARLNSASEPSLGVGGWDPSTTAAIVQINSCSTAQDQLFFRPGGTFPTSPLEGGMSYSGGYLNLSHKIAGTGSTVSERIAMGGSVQSSQTPGVIAVGAEWESGDIAITNMNSGDLVKVTPPGSLETGLMWCWIPGGSAGNVRLRIFNVNNATVASTGAVARTWTFTVEH